MADWKIIHNPRCSKSREALNLLDESGIEPTVVLYLKDPLTPDELVELVGQLSLRPAAMLRSKEPVFKELELDLDDDAAVILAIAEHPELLERPIVVHGDRAVIGRPIENVRTLIDESTRK